MELHERLRAPGTTDESAIDPFALLKNRIHQYVITELGPQLYQQDMDPDALRARVLAVIRQELATKDDGFVVISEPFLAEWIRRNALGQS